MLINFIKQMLKVFGFNFETSQDEDQLEIKFELHYIQFLIASISLIVMSYGFFKLFKHLSTLFV